MTAGKRPGTEEATTMSTTTVERPAVAVIDPTLHSIYERVISWLHPADEHTGATRAQDVVTVAINVRGRHVTDVTIQREGAATVYRGWDGEQTRRYVDEDAYTLGVSNVLTHLGEVRGWWMAHHESVDPASGLVITRAPASDRAGLLAYAVRYVTDVDGAVRALIGRPDALVAVPTVWVAVTSRRAPLGSFASAVTAAHAGIMQAREDATYATGDNLTGHEQRVLEAAAHIRQTPRLDEDRTIRQYVDVSPTVFWQTLLGLVERSDLRAVYADAFGLVEDRRARRRR